MKSLEEVKNNWIFDDQGYDKYCLSQFMPIEEASKFANYEPNNTLGHNYREWNVENVEEEANYIYNLLMKSSNIDAFMYDILLNVLEMYEFALETDI
jgi:hypothetical protein